MSVKEKEKNKISDDNIIGDEHQIILYNDDFNTFDHVIQTLISVCDHTPVQAEQCTLIVHYKGKCSVKSGTLIDLKPRLKKMVDAKLSAEIIKKPKVIILNLILIGLELDFGFDCMYDCRSSCGALRHEVC